MIEEHRDEEALDVRELVPADGGTWGGLLFDNPRFGLAAELTWSFTFPFAPVDRSYGSTPVSLGIDWLPLPTGSWRDMTGQFARKVGEPAEASVYFFEHFRYDVVDLEILGQRGPWVHARATLSGDLEALGPDPVTADAWLRFTGIVVSVSAATSAGAALTRLRAFTDVDGLSPRPGATSASFRFVPVDAPGTVAPGGRGPGQNDPS